MSEFEKDGVDEKPIWTNSDEGSLDWYGDASTPLADILHARNILFSLSDQDEILESEFISD